jgi:hypothetical protein
LARGIWRFGEPGSFNKLIKIASAAVADDFPGRSWAESSNRIYGFSSKKLNGNHISYICLDLSIRLPMPSLRRFVKGASS